MAGGLFGLIITNQMQQKWSRIATFISLLIIAMAGLISYANEMEFAWEYVRGYSIIVAFIYFTCWSIHWIASAGKGHPLLKSRFCYIFFKKF